MTDERRQELFRDAEPAAEGRTFRVIGALAGFVILVAMGWNVLSLNDVREDIRALQEDETRRVVVLNADLKSLRRETNEEFNSVKNALSGVWHKHKPAELEIMGFLASLDPGERKSMLAGLESLESGKDLPGNNRSGENGGRVEEPTLVSPTKPVLVSPARSFSGADARGAVENENTAADESGPQGEASPSGEESEETRESEIQGPSGPAGALEPPEGEMPPAKDLDEKLIELKEYIIQPGDSLSRIALKHQVSSGDLAEANGITDPNKIRVGQVLKIP